MRRIDRHRRQQQIEFPFAIVFDEGAGILIQFVQAENADSLLRKLRAAAVHSSSGTARQQICECPREISVALFHQGQAVRPGFGVAVFNLLHQPGHPHFEKFIEIAGADGEKFQPLEQRIAFILRLFQHAPVELQPRKLRG